MRAQRFQGNSVRAAHAEARTALGLEALGLSTDMVPARGWRRLVGRREVQLTAAVVPIVSESRPVPTSTRPTAVSDPPPGRRSRHTAWRVVARLGAAGVRNPFGALAALVAVLRGAGLRVSWPGCGQRVPEHLHRATGRLLARAVAGELWVAGRIGRIHEPMEELCAYGCWWRNGAIAIGWCWSTSAW